MAESQEQVVTMTDEQPTKEEAPESSSSQQSAALNPLPDGMSPAVDRQHGFYLGLTLEEEKQIQELRSLIPEPDSVADETYIRYLRGYGHDVTKAHEMLTAMLTWRKENNIDQLADQVLPKQEEYDRSWPSFVSGQSTNGCPVYIELTGRIDVAALNSFSPEEIEMYHVRMMERLQRRKIELSKNAGQVIYKHVVIMDLTGLSRHHCSSKFYGPLKKVIKIDQDFYPDTLYKFFIINSPWIFTAAWKVIRPWLDPITREKINVLSGSYQNELLKTIEAGELPEQFGGTAQVNLPVTNK